MRVKRKRERKAFSKISKMNGTQQRRNRKSTHYKKSVKKQVIAEDSKEETNAEKTRGEGERRR